MRKIAIKKIPKRIFITPKRVPVETHKTVDAEPVVVEEPMDTVLEANEVEVKAQVKKNKKAHKKDEEPIHGEEISEN